jgi:methyltransferase, fkbM family
MTFEQLRDLPQRSLFDDFRAAYEAHPEMKIIVFGAGDQGMLAALLLRENDMPPYAFCDNNIALHGTEVKGLPVIAPSDIPKMAGDYAVINNDSYRAEKRTQLLDLGVPDENIWTFDVFNPLFKDFTRSYIEEHEEAFRHTYELLADEVSRKTYVNYLAGVYTADPVYYEEIAVGNDYFPPELAPKHPNHVFLDVGTYDGNTIEVFIDFAKTYEKIHAFEPFAASADLIAAKNFLHTELHRAAASDVTGKKTFYCNNYGSLTMVTTILEKGAKHEAITLDTIRIDDAVAGERATFIKMDIEGSELDALHGAAQTIRENRPFLAICVYHKRDDLIRIVPYIKELVPDYKIYLRHHSKTGSDLVLYCS